MRGEEGAKEVGSNERRGRDGGTHMDKGRLHNQLQTYKLHSPSYN